MDDPIGVLAVTICVLVAVAYFVVEVRQRAAFRSEARDRAARERSE
jgi:hypothetical protein